MEIISLNLQSLVSNILAKWVSYLRTIPKFVAVLNINGGDELLRDNTFTVPNTI